MADFESTASAAVTKLQEIDEICGNSRSQYTDAESRLEESRQEFDAIAALPNWPGIGVSG